MAVHRASLAFVDGDDMLCAAGLCWCACQSAVCGWYALSFVGSAAGMLGAAQHGGLHVCACHVQGWQGTLSTGSSCVAAFAFALTVCFARRTCGMASTATAWVSAGRHRCDHACLNWPSMFRCCSL
jgi:hypothetical protein